MYIFFKYSLGVAIKMEGCAHAQPEIAQYPH